MVSTLVVDDLAPLIRVAVVNDGVLKSLDADQYARPGMLDSIYWAQVSQVTPEKVQWELAPGLRAYSRREAEFPPLTEGCSRFVQVSRESFIEKVGITALTKPLEVTQKLAFAHRSLVYWPSSGVYVPRSHRSPDPHEQEQVTSWYDSIKNSKKRGLIWQGPTCLERSLRDHDHIDTIFVSTPKLAVITKEACQKYRVDLTSKIKLKQPQASSLLEDMGLIEQWDECLSPLIPLNQGAHLILQTTSVATMIDLNTGALKADEFNLSVIPKLAEQLAWRRISGRVFIDFAGFISSLVLRKKIEKMLKDHVQDDRPKWHILGWSKSGILELQRERRRISLEQVIQL